jgi:hypothetical protein
LSLGKKQGKGGQEKKPNETKEIIEFLEACQKEKEREGRPIVIKKLNNRPELFIDLYPYWQAFNILTDSRPVGFGVAPIPFSEIASFLFAMKIDGLEERTEYIRWVQYIDTIFVEEARKKENVS